MKRGPSLLFLPLAILVGAAAPVDAGRVTPAQLDAVLQSGVDRGSPGLSAAIASCRGVIWTGVAGSADIAAHRPIDQADLFGVGSITKVFLAVTVLQLIEEKRLKLTDTAESILGARAIRDIANARTATIADLLGHRAGVPSWEDDRRWIRKGRGAGIQPGHVWEKTEALDYIRGVPATSAAGAKFAYSNSGYTLLGLIVEKATHRTAESEIRRRILSPLGLSDTYMEGFEAGQPARVPHRYQFATEKFRKDAGMAPGFTPVAGELVDVGDANLSVEWTAGGIVSSPRDLVLFARALRGGRLLRPESLAFMEQWGAAFKGMDYGHGLFRINAESGPLIGHTGGVLGFSAVLWWAGEGDTIVAVLGNGSGMHAGRTPPKASNIGLDEHFVELARKYAEQQGSCPPTGPE